MYPDDHNDSLAPNAALGAPPGVGWVSGAYMSWDANPANTNEAFLKDGSLAPYLKNQVKVYKCPSDKVPSANGHRLRSISMNAMVGHISTGPPRYYTTPNYYPGYAVFRKMGDITRGAIDTSRLFIFLDEHPGSINDAYFQVNMTSKTFPDVPASYHNKAASFSFADGHAEIRRWKNASTYQPVQQGVVVKGIPAGTEDWEWLTERTSYRE
jgi:prepilin-type processing-associated H-X9-DG protein